MNQAYKTPIKTLKLRYKCKPNLFIKQIFVYVLKHKIIYIFVLNLHHITDDK